ncbi:MAG: ATP-dependent DNA ligase [Spirochaetia bacterium]
MKFAVLAELFQEIENTSATKTKRDIAAEYFIKLDPEEAAQSAYFLTGSIGPGYKNTDLGIGDEMMLDVLHRVCGCTKEKIKEESSEYEDFAEWAEANIKDTGSGLSISEVFNQVWKIQRTSGKGSYDKKISRTKKLLQQAAPKEVKYIIRLILDELRLGMGEKTLFSSLALAFTGTKENKKLLEEKFTIDPDIGELAESLAEYGTKGIKRMSISLGRPILPMLAQRIDSFDELLKRLPQPLAAEEKYDGERVQIHKDGEAVTAFSRRLEDISSQYPEIIENAKTQITAEKAILDGEIIPFENGKAGSFQKLMQRRRKYNIAEYREKIPVSVFLFDALYKNGKSMLKKSYPERRKILEYMVSENEKLQLAQRKVSEEITEIRGFFQNSIDKGLEGIIAKSTGDDSVYQAGKRGMHWIKWKKEYSQEMQDTFDLVVIGSFYGKGRRKEAFGALLCAAYQPENERFLSVTKLGSGFTDKDFEELEHELKKNERETKPKEIEYTQDMEPDIFYKPSLVIEVIGSEITESPSHIAGRGENTDKGLALRFPRFIRIRPDKGPKDATTVDEIVELKK